MSVCAGTWSIHDRKNKKKGSSNMAKSKLVTTNRKIAEKVVDTYQKIEHTVIGGYTKIEDAFVGHYLTQDGETVDDAKARLKREQKQNTKQ